jgi:glycosyltransferase involved in cell wall biosynthesis
MRFLLTLDDLNAINGYVIAPRQLAIALRKAGHKAKIFCRVPPKVMFKGESKDDFLRIGIGSILNNKLLKDYDPDVVICNSHYPTDMIAMDYAHKHKVLSLYYVHSRIEKLIKSRVFLGEYWPEFLINSVVKIFKDELKHVDVIIALSEQMRDYLDSLFPRAKLEIISNGIDLDLFEYRDRRLDQDNIELLYVANFEPRKNQLFLLKVMNELPSNYRLHLVGGKEDPTYYDKFKKALKRYKGENVVMHGKLDLHEVLPLYEKAHLFVDSSLMEAQSLVLLEAMAVGLPIIRIYNQDTAGVTVHKKTAWHVNDRTDAKGFARAIKKLCKDEDLYKSIRSNQKQERLKYGRDAAVKQLLDVVEKYKA